MKSLQIWVFIRIISAKSTPAWQTPHPLIWSKRDKKKKKTGGGLAPGWCGISLPRTWATQHEELAELEVTCIELCFNLHLPHASPGCLHRSLHCFAHYVTIAKKIKNVIQLWAYASVAEAAHTHTDTHTTPADLTTHLDASPEAVISHTHTHRASCQTASLAHLFKTPNTFAHIVTDVCFHQPTQGGFVEQSGIQMSDNPCRMRGVCVFVCVWERWCSGQPRLTDWLTDCLDCGRGWCRPSHRLSKGLPPASKQLTSPTEMSLKLTAGSDP